MSKRIFLIHGENDYLIYKDLKDRKKEFEKNNIEFHELQGSKSLQFSQIYESLASTSFFAASSNVIIRDLGERNSIYPFVEELIDFIPKIESQENEIFIYHRGKIAKNTKIYKAIDKYGEIKEYFNPKDEETISVIKKSLNIEEGAAKLLVEYSNGNLFSIKSEIKKLTNLNYKSDYKITSEDIEKYCVKMRNSNEVWGIGKNFIDTLIEDTNGSRLVLIEEFENNIKNEVEPMQILYSLYNYVLSFIKMKRLIKKGKGFRECLSVGYFFVKDFFNKSDSVDEKRLYEINSLLLEYEYQVKSGLIDDVNGLRKVILSL